MAAARERPTADLKIVVIGGGSGTSAVLQGLTRYTERVSAIVTMFDSGGSSGLLQEEFGYPPLGDLRQCLVGLSNGDEASRPLRELVDFRFNQESSLNGHSLGNLLLAALTTLGKDLEQAVDNMARLLRITGQVIPVSLDRADLCAVLTDGQLLRGESTIDLRRQLHPRIERVFLDPVVPANPRGIQAVLDADVVALGPGDLYTSIIPNFLADGMTEALAATGATRVYICNLMTKLGETDGFTAYGFVREMHRYLGGAQLDWALVNAGGIPGPVREAYRLEGAYPVAADMDAIGREVPGVYAAGLGNDEIPLKHRSNLVAEAIINIARAGRVSEPTLRSSPGLSGDGLSGRGFSSGTGANGFAGLAAQEPPPALAPVSEPD